ncbi:MAG: LLM class F420-dependent oxidoreductase [Acidimicrobiales bacterium]|nr:LLM class F420-dependent oxidoreductase [Acidimicrobiales bacterium]
MDFGVVFANVGMFASPDGAAAIGKAAEDAGFDSVWTVEHVVVPDGYQSRYPYDESGRMPGDGMIDMPDPLIWLTWVAAHTSTLNLGTGILIATQRNPLVLAKEVASLDRLSGGRVRLGVGVGWLAEEFDAIGVPFERRGDRLDEYIAVMRTLWSEHKATFHGEFCAFDNAVMLPKPANGTVPIIIGGHTKAAARRAGRLGDGFFPGRTGTEELGQLLAIMRKAAEDAGRNPDSIEITCGSQGVFGDDPIGAVHKLEDLGVSRIVIPPLSFSPTDIAEALGRFGENVIAKVN